ncbi:hypothetical protein [Haloferula sp.]
MRRCHEVRRIGKSIHIDPALDEPPLSAAVAAIGVVRKSQREKK